MREWNNMAESRELEIKEYRTELEKGRCLLWLRHEDPKHILGY
jgi:hypothetical protein